MSKILGPKTIVVVGTIFVLAACQTDPVQHSGFLKDYSNLKADKVVEGAMSEGDRARLRADYDKFIIDPVIIHFAPNTKGYSVKPMEITEMVSHFDTNARKAFEDRKLLATVSGPRVARIRVAITDINEGIPPLNIHPLTKLSGLGLGGATMEAEILDSQSNKRIFAIVDTQKGTMAFQAGLTRLGHARQVMDMWIERAMKLFDPSS